MMDFSSDGRRSGRLLYFNEREALTRCKDIEEELKQVVIVIEGLTNIMLEMLHIIEMHLSSLTELLEVDVTMELLDLKVFQLLLDFIGEPHHKIDMLMLHNLIVEELSREKIYFVL